MTHIGLFEGIGGFSLAGKAVGFKTVAVCEIDKFCQQVLKYHFPESTLYEDITKTDFKKYCGTIDIITGGFPCQPFSVAGSGEGVNDPRHLWPQMLRAIQEVKPTWVIGENVPGIITNASGMVFRQVQADLEAEGYQVQVFNIPAAGVNARHKRERIWFVAYTHRPPTSDKIQTRGQKFRSIFQRYFTTNPNKKRLQATRAKKQTKGFTGIIFHPLRKRRKQLDAFTKPGKQTVFNRTNITIKTTWKDFPTEPPICCGNDGLPDRLDGITFSKWRNESIKAYGNAIVPQIAINLYTAIIEFNKIIDNEG